MGRHIAAIFVAVCVAPSWASAQTTTMKVTATSADVYMSPSTGSPVIGHVRAGTVLVVSRELGSWVKVPWPDGKDGVGYVHVSKGTIAHDAPSGDRAAAPASAPAARRASTMGSPAPVAARAAGAEQPLPQNRVYVTPATHAVGVGGLVAGPSAAFGASARAWRRDRIGMQFDVSRSALTSAVTPGRATSVEFEPSALYSMPDRVADYWWLRPYVGAGLSMRRQTLASGTAGTADLSDSSIGFHVFGGGEVTFSSMPRFTISADVSYRSLPAPFSGFDANKLGISVSGRWYVK